jgi:hypothetical protein
MFEVMRAGGPEDKGRCRLEDRRYRGPEDKRDNSEGQRLG